MNLFRKVSAFLIASVMMFLAACSSTKEPETFHGVVFPVSVYSDVVIEEAFVRTAEYPEDGSFEKKKDVFALKVRNESDKAIQLLRIKVTTDKKEMLFEITTLPVNMSVNVFEKSGQTLSKDEKILEISGENRADFEKPVGLKREIFELDVHDKVINVKNDNEEGTQITDGTEIRQDQTVHGIEIQNHTQRSEAGAHQMERKPFFRNMDLFLLL